MDSWYEHRDLTSWYGLCVTEVREVEEVVAVEIINNDVLQKYLVRVGRPL